jgi:hypothetical protein
VGVGCLEAAVWRELQKVPEELVHCQDMHGREASLADEGSKGNGTEHYTCQTLFIAISENKYELPAIKKLQIAVAATKVLPTNLLGEPTDSLLCSSKLRECASQTI